MKSEFQRALANAYAEVKMMTHDGRVLEIDVRSALAELQCLIEKLPEDALADNINVALAHSNFIAQVNRPTDGKIPVGGGAPEPSISVRLGAKPPVEVE